MRYYGEFADLKNEIWSYEAISNNLTTKTIELKFAKNSPLVIETDGGDNLFSGVKPRSCTAKIITDKIYEDLYSPTLKGVRVEVKNKTRNEVFFQGYLTPCAYNTQFTKPYEELELEAVDGLSILQNINYTACDGIEPGIRTIPEILWHIFQTAGYTGSIYIPKNVLATYYRASTFYANETIINHKLNENNFFDDDDEKTPWSMMDALDEIAKFLCCSVCSYKDSIYFIDYRLVDSNQPQTYYKIDSANPNSSRAMTFETVDVPNILIQKNNYFSKSQSISYDSVYNKISVQCSIYELDDLLTNVFEDEGNYLTNYTEGITVWTSKKEGQKATNYYSIFKFTDDSPRWSMKRYRMDNFAETTGYFRYSSTEPNHPYIDDTIACYPISYWDVKTKSSEVKYEATNLFAFHTMCASDSGWRNQWGTNNSALTATEKTNLKNYLSHEESAEVLIYKHPQEITWTIGGNNYQSNYLYNYPNGVSFICINMELFYNVDHSGNKVNTHFYSTDSQGYYDVLPLDSMEYRSGEYVRAERGSNDGNYGKGWPMMQARLQIGDKFWNGSVWTNTPSTFWIYFHKDKPDNGDNETFVYNGWVKNVCNTYVDTNDIYNIYNLVGEECLAIPMNTDLSGKMEFALCSPRLWMDDGNMVWNSSNTGYDFKYDYSNIWPLKSNGRYGYNASIVNMKGFEISYKYVPSGYTWKTIENYDDGDDIIYTNVINENYSEEFDDLELKINTRADKKPISLSYVMDNNGNYIENFITPTSITNNRKKQEYNVIDYYYNHFSNPKMIFDADVKDYYAPYNSLYIRTLGKNFCVHTQEYDCKKGINTINAIEY